MNHYFKLFSNKQFFLFTPVLVYFTFKHKFNVGFDNKNEAKNKGRSVLNLNSNTNANTIANRILNTNNSTSSLSKLNTKIFDAPEMEELDFHVKNFEHHFEHLLKKEIKFNPAKINHTQNHNHNHTNPHAPNPIVNAILNYQKNKEVNKLFIEIRKINKHLKTYLNLLSAQLNSHTQITSPEENIKNLFNYLSQNNINFDALLENLKKVESKKKKFQISTDKEINTILINFLFSDYEEIAMRLFSNIVVFYKNLKNIKEENIKFIIDFCIERLNEEEIKINEAKLYHAKRVLINLFSRPDYFYGDFILEINHSVNYPEFTAGGFNKNSSCIKEDDDFDYDVIFISGLNANFSKSWRIPREEHLRHANLQNHIEYYLHGKHIDKIFSVPSYELWIPTMFEKTTFKDKKVRYMVTCADTKFFPHELERQNIPDFSIEDIADRFYNSFLKAGIGKRPLILVCHSMGGLICKKILYRAKEEGQLLSNVKGVVFFSTPHFGSNVIQSLLEVGLKRYLGLFKVFETTSVEYGLHEEDITHRLIDFRFTKATEDVCLRPRSTFVDEHEKFVQLRLKYICLNETKKTFVKAFGKYVDIVDPDSRYLPETENFLLENKTHSNLQKFSPENLEEEGYIYLTNFIRNNFEF